MSLLEIRQKFIESSGRTDLVVDTTSLVDAGANWFIQAGQRYLDHMLETGNARARYFGKLDANRNTIKIPRARVIESVSRSYPIPRVALYLSDKPDLFVSDTLGVPESYSRLVLRPVIGSDYSQIQGMDATVSFESHSYQGILFNILAGADYGIEVTGLFYSPALVLDTDQSFWTEEYPEILVAAAFLSMERFYRNFEGLKECRASVEDMVQQLDFDYVAQEIVNISRMEG